MSDVTLRMDHVFKKFSRGERHDSLRDLIPHLTKRAVRSLKPSELGKQEFWALNDVSFEVKRGESLAIIGHNGAGKSTMLKHLSGVLKPTSGSLSVNGRLAAMIEVGAGFHGDLTGRENVYLNGAIMGMSRAEIRRKFDEIVDFSGLEDFIDTPVKRYSSGMYARLGFSVAAHIEPEILVIDEVLSVGDATFQAKGIAKMKSVLNSGATVIFVSHNLHAVADLCSRSILMEKGRLLHDGPTSEVIQTYMESLRATRTRRENDPVVVTNVEVYSGQAKRLDFKSGDEARVLVTIKAKEPITQLNCLLDVTDEKLSEIFRTSSQRLGAPRCDLAAGESTTYEFKLDLHLTPGRYYVNLDLQQGGAAHYVHAAPMAATVLVSSDATASGGAQLYPALLIGGAPLLPLESA